MVPPVLGRPSPASAKPGRLRASGSATTAAYRAEAGDADGWSLRAASVAGVRHRLAGEDVQDAYAFRVVGGDTVVVAVGDGVGGVAGSGAAAAAAVAAAVDAASIALDAAVAPDEGFDRALDAAVAGADVAVREAGGATTLVVAVVAADGTGLAVRVGDSTALRLAGGAWHELWPTAEPDGDVVSTATAALPATAPVQDRVGIALAPGEALVLVTDGVDGPRRDGPTTVGPALAAGLEGDPSALELAVLVDFSRQGCFDDRTVVAVRRIGPATGLRDT